MKFDLKMVLEYPKVFAENYDKGDPEAPLKSVQGALGRKGGQTIVNGYFTSQADIDKLIQAGLDLKPMNYDRILDGNQEFGIGKFIKIKRDFKDNIKKFTQKDGSVVEVNYGGLPRVIDFRDPQNKKDWDVEKDGFLGNGTEAIVRFDMYSDGAGIRLEAIAVTKLVPYDRDELKTPSEYADIWDS